VSGDPLNHFLATGHHEARVPNRSYERIAPALRLRAQVSPSPLADLIRLFPNERNLALTRDRVWERIQWSVHPEFYAAQRDIEPLDLDASIQDFLGRGIFEGARPGILFQTDWYAARFEELTGEPVPDSCHPFFHWVTDGWQRRVVPTPLFDAEYYRERHDDMKRWRDWTFVHYLRYGAYEVFRKSSPLVDKPQLPDPTAKERKRPLLLDKVLADPGPDISLLTEFERQATQLAEKVARLQRPTMREMAEKAYAIEPLIRRPYGPREVSAPPLRNHATALFRAGEQVRGRFARRRYDTVVLVPHCRMAGSARVTGALVAALRDLRPDEHLVVVTTDLPDFERPDWFPERTEVVDVSTVADTLGPEYQVRLLLDVVRGLSASRVINVNSRRAWELFRTFGRQLATMTELDAYLFTWDLDAKGNKGGYPISYFQECFPYLNRVFVDSSALRRELIWRYALSSELQTRICELFTPADAPGAIDHSGNFAARRASGEPLRAFWSGRFDRQKRFDLVVGIAEALPDLEILAWGKQVIGGSSVDFDRLPPNLLLQGTYQTFEELPVVDCDFFLYTSQWDGVPTILIDAGARGVPTLASNVGGVGDILNSDTGFPVDDALNVDAYVKSISTMLSAPDEVTRRAAHFRDHVRTTCSRARYAGDLASALAIDLGPGLSQDAGPHSGSEDIDVTPLGEPS